MPLLSDSPFFFFIKARKGRWSRGNHKGMRRMCEESGKEVHWSEGSHKGMRRACEESGKAIGLDETRKGRGEHVRKAGRPLVGRKPQRDEERL